MENLKREHMKNYGCDEETATMLAISLIEEEAQLQWDEEPEDADDGLNMSEEELAEQVAALKAVLT
jgi:hypothetical protein